ncbi:TetR/AcrR family fatty acid metabolism transcriptional regulator [Salibacterium salarium]|uniref:TetR/AcrR family transcriptional regulator n=1 Tax=Salibacterium salarium TaxID=284579 RepID=UPI0027819E79|nr:TetR/AcrR family transcriptional regulator [Salibacterium salarium]MDQ0298625.1 TetR/AcrR family fatty acid metabolism transcriptional regulator [Salibacterium salarium]
MATKKGPKYDQIIDAAVTVIAQNGYHQAQVSRIAKEAGVADGTIYLYFKNKEDILISLFEEKMGTFVDHIRSKLTEANTIEEELQFLVEMHLKQLAADKNLAVVTQLELRQSNYKLRQRINEVLKEYLSVMESIIEKGKASNVFSQDVNDKLARQMIFGTLDEVTTNWVMKDCKYDLESLSKPVFDMLLQGFKLREDVL